jgi:hypothetical protein
MWRDGKGYGAYSKEWISRQVWEEEPPTPIKKKKKK